MKATFTLLFSVLTICLFAQNDTMANDSTKIVHSAMNRSHFNKDKRWSVGLSVGGGMSYRTVRSRPYSELVHCRAVHESHVRIPEMGLQVKYDLNKHFSLFSGVNYFQTGFDLTEQLQLSDTLDVEFVIACNVYDAVDPQRGFIRAGFYDPRFLYVIMGFHPSTAEMNIQLRYHYAEVPLLLQLHTNQPKWNGYFALGTSINYMIYTEHHYTLVHNGDILREYSADAGSWYPSYNRWNFGSLANAGISYTVTEKFSAGLEFRARYQLRNLFSKERFMPESYIEHHYTATGNLSLQYQF